MGDPAHPRALRPLLPAPLSNPPQPVNQQTIDTSSSQSSQIIQRSRGVSTQARTSRPPRVQIAVACTTCQRKKCKCDGRRPCQTCEKSGADCVYDIESGFTRSQAMKRKNEVLSEDNKNLRYIVQGLRRGSEQEASEIMRRIRGSHDVDEAIAYINEASLLLGAAGNSPEAHQSDEPVQNHIRQRMNPALTGSRALTLQMLLNPPMDHAPALASNTSEGSSSSTASRRRESIRSGSDPTSQSSTIPSTPHAQRSPPKQPTTLIKWITWTAQSKQQPSSMESVGTADRLNALLDNLSFIGNRPAGSFPSPTQASGATYLPYVSVPAHPWTTVTDDDDFVSQLMMLFFTWEQPWYSFVNMTTFLLDMHDLPPDLPYGTAPQREFCSPALVNAILAMGALSSRHPLAYAVPNQPTTRGQQFLEEAERLIREEMKGKPNITTLKAIWLTLWYRSCSGYKFRSNEFHDSIYEIFEELGLGNPQPRPVDYDINSKARLYFHARAEVIWGMYCHDAVLAIANGYRARIMRPMIEQTFEDEDPMDSPPGKATNAWWPYPDFKTPMPALRQTGLRLKILLVDIMHDMFHFLDAFDSDVDFTDEYLMTEATRIYHRYTTWYEALPEQFTPHGSVLPHVIFLRASYHVSVITLFRALQDVEIAYGHMWNHPRCKVIMHAQALLTTMNTLRDNWTLFRHCYAMQTHWLPAFALLFYIEPGEPVGDVFTQAIRGLHEVGQKWPVAAWMVKVIRGMVDEYTLQTPHESEKWMRLDSSKGRDKDASDVMLPVTIPLKSELSNPLLKGLRSGVYIEDLNAVLTKLESVRMNE